MKLPVTFFRSGKENKGHHKRPSLYCVPNWDKLGGTKLPLNLTMWTSLLASLLKVRLPFKEFAIFSLHKKLFSVNLEWILFDIFVQGWENCKIGQSSHSGKSHLPQPKGKSGHWLQITHHWRQFTPNSAWFRKREELMKWRKFLCLTSHSSSVKRSCMRVQEAALQTAQEFWWLVTSICVQCALDFFESSQTQPKSTLHNDLWLLSESLVECHSSWWVERASLNVFPCFTLITFMEHSKPWKDTPFVSGNIFFHRKILTKYRLPNNFFRSWGSWKVNIFETHFPGVGKWQVIWTQAVWLYFSHCTEGCQTNPKTWRHDCWPACSTEETKSFSRSYQADSWRTNKQKNASSAGWIWWIQERNKQQYWQYPDQKKSATFMCASHLKRHQRTYWTQTTYGCWGRNHRVWSRESWRVHGKLFGKPKMSEADWTHKTKPAQERPWWECWLWHHADTNLSAHDLCSVSEKSFFAKN